jgi:hypothetical protein
MFDFLRSPKTSTTKLIREAETKNTYATFYAETGKFADYKCIIYRSFGPTVKFDSKENDRRNSEFIKRNPLFFNGRTYELVKISWRIIH